MKTKKIKNTPIRQLIYNNLRAAILSGQLERGTRLIEENLAKEYTVSRTPVREALHKLEIEGFIKLIKPRGFIVPDDSRDEIDEQFEIRAILEGYVLGLVCERISHDQLQSLGRFIKKSEKALKAGQSLEVFRWNTRFHDLLYNIIKGKQRLYQLVCDMRKYVLRYREDSLRYLSGAKRSIDGHKKIVMALELKDRDLCERVMRVHVQEAKEDAMTSLFTPLEREPSKEVSEPHCSNEKRVSQNSTEDSISAQQGDK